MNKKVFVFICRIINSNMSYLLRMEGVKMEKEAKLVIDAKAILGEGPCWDELTDTLYWVDIEGKKLHVYETKNNQDHSFDVGQHIGACVLKETGGLILAMENGLYCFDINRNQLTPIVDPEEGISTNRFNDGKCDSSGRFFAGTMAFDGSKEKGSLYCLHNDLTVTRVLSNVTISNGIAWDDKKGKMYYNDTGVNKVYAFDYDPKTGRLSNQTVAIDVIKEHGGPDGMTIDNEGMLWIAHWGGAKVARWNPDNGDLLYEVKVPASHVTSCTFGGENLDELYITTARTGISEEELLKQPLAGGVFKIKTNVSGAPSYRFKG